MELYLDDKHRLVTDRTNFILEKLEPVKDKKTNEIRGEEWKNKGFFGYQIEHALKRYQVEVIRSEGEMTAEQLLNKLKEIEETIKKVVKQENIRFPQKSNNEEA